jgi:hypothetical protein
MGMLVVLVIALGLLGYGIDEWVIGGVLVTLGLMWISDRRRTCRGFD